MHQLLRVHVVTVGRLTPPTEVQKATWGSPQAKRGVTRERATCRVNLYSPCCIAGHLFK